MNLATKFPGKRTVLVLEIRSKSENVWYYATYVKCMLHLRKKMQMLSWIFFKFCTLRPKRCALAGSTKTHLVCVSRMHQNAVLLVDATDWDVNYKDLINKVVCDSSNKECVMNHCESCPEIAELKTLLNEQLCDVDLDIEFHYSQWNTKGRATLAITTTTYKNYKKILIETMIS